MLESVPDDVVIIIGGISSSSSSSTATLPGLFGIFAVDKL